MDQSSLNPHPKEAEDNRYHRFRNINIYEADFNLMTKLIVTKKTMQNAEKLGLHNEQWGGRQGSLSVDLLAKKISFL